MWEGRSVQNVVCAPKMGSSLVDNPDQTKTSMTVTCRLWEEGIDVPRTRCFAGTDHRASALSQVQLQLSFPVNGIGPPAARSCLAVTNVCR